MNRKLEIAVVVALLGIFVLLGLDTIRHLSPTYDEPLHLAAGYSYLKTGRYYLNIYDHPPFAEMTAALPLVFMRPLLLTQHPAWENYRQYSFANVFLYSNRVDAEKMLNAGRKMMLLLSCLLGFAVYLWSRELYGVFPGVLALALYVFSSMFLANGTLVTTDLSMALFYFLGVYAFWKWARYPSSKNAIFAGAACALALVSKFSAVILFGVYGILLAYLLFSGKAGAIRKRFAGHTLIFLLAALAVILAVYRVDSAGLYFEGLKRTLLRLETGRSSFLAGSYSTMGWKYYFLAVFLLKTPVPLLLLLLVAGFTGTAAGKRRDNMFLLVPVALYFLVASFSKVQIGHRHIMPIYPFLFVYASGLIADTGPGVKARFKRFLVPACGVMFAWYVFSCIRIHPWHISYFNEFAGNKGYEYLTDSNIDWGQGLKELGKWYAARDPGCMYLCYFGVGDPHYYGIRYVPLGFVDNLDRGERPGDSAAYFRGKTFFAISVTNLQATYYADKNAFGWLKKLEPASRLAAGSIFVYDLTGDREAISRLASMTEGR
jgi:hypothetical protein